MSLFEELVKPLLRDAPVPLNSIARQLGIPVFLSSLNPKISGLIEPCDEAPSGFRIRLNRHEPVERQRFTLAHEISHFLLHRSLIGSGVVDDTMYRSALSSRREVEANKLAAELAMPMSLVRRYERDFDGLEDTDKIAAMAKKFRVSKAAMKIRMGL